MTSTITSAQPSDVEAPTRHLTAEDRCDRCGAQAYTVWVQDGLDLEMCVHHTRTHAESLAAQGFEKTVDNTHLL